MFFHTLTEATFHKGLKIYLNGSATNPEGVAKPHHLYKALDRALIDENLTLSEDYLLAALFESWEVNAGYPIVYVERSYNDRRIRFVQVRQIQFSLFCSLDSAEVDYFFLIFLYFF